MTVRELIIKFGFEVDRQSQRNVENSVNGVRNLMQRLLQGIQIVFSSSGAEQLREQLTRIQEEARGVQDSIQETERSEHRSTQVSNSRRTTENASTRNPRRTSEDSPEKIAASVKRSMQEIASASGRSLSEVRAEVVSLCEQYQAQGVSAAEAVQRAMGEVADAVRQSYENIDSAVVVNELEEIASASGRTVDEIRSDVERIASEYQSMGIDASTSMRNALGEVSESSSRVHEEINHNIEDTAETAEHSSHKIISGFKKVIGVIGAAFAIDKIREFGQECIEAAATTNATASQFEQVFGELEGDAEKSLQKISEDTGVFENRMKASYTKIAAFAKTTGMETEDALQLTNRSMVAIADSAAFYDRSLEDVTETMQSFLKGNFENDSALGLSCTEVTRNTAANKLYGKSFQDLDESQKQLTLLKMVEDANATSGALGQAARESDTLENQMGNLKQALFDLKSVAGQYLLEPFIAGLKFVTKGVQAVTEKVPNMVDTIKKGMERIRTGTQGIHSQLDRVHALVKRLQPAAERFLQAAWNGTKKTISIVKEVIERLGGIENVLKILSVVVGAFILAMNWGKLVNGAKSFVMMLKTIGKLFSAANLKILGVVAVIVLLALLVEDFINFLMGNDSLIGEMFDKAGIGADNAREAILNAFDFIKTAAGQVKDKLLEVWESISTAFLTIANVLYSVGSAIFQALATVIEAVFQAVKAFWDAWGSEVLAWFQVLWDSLAGTLSGFLDVIKGIADLITAIFTGDWQAAWEAVKDIFLGIWKIIVSYFTAVLETIKLVLTIALSTISSVWKAVWEAIKKFFLNIWNKIVSFLSNVLTKIKTYFTNTFDNIRTSIVEKVTRIKDAIINGIMEAVNWIKNLPQEAVQWGADMIDGMVDGIKGAIGKVKDAVSNVAENIKSFLHFSVPDEGPLTDYESWMPDFMSGLAKGIAENKDKVLEKVRSLAGDMSILMQAATAQSATVAASMGSYNNQNSIMQTNNFNSTYIGNDREVAKHISKGMKKSASDATTELARAMAFSRG